MALELLLKSASAEILLNTKPRYSGWLQKKRDCKSKKLVHRYCIIHGSNFFYFDDNKSKKPNGGFSLDGYRAFVDKASKLTVLIKHGESTKRTYIFEAGSERERTEWIRQINKAVLDNLKPVKSASEEEQIYENPHSLEYDYRTPDDVHFFDDDPYLRILSKGYPTGSFHGPNIFKEPQLPSRNSAPNPPSGKDDNIYTDVIDENQHNKRNVPPTPPPYDEGMDGRYVLSHEIHSDGYLTLAEIEEKKEAIYGNVDDSSFLLKSPDAECNTMNPIEPGYYETMNQNNSESEYEPMHPSPYEKMGSARAVDGVKSTVYDFPTEHYVSPKKVDFATELAEKLAISNRLLHVRPIPAPRSGSLKSKAQTTLNVKYLSDDDILPQSVYQRELSRDHCGNVLKSVDNRVGTYLIRRARNGKDVLSVLDEESDGVRHYIIFVQNGKHFLREDEPKFDKIPDLIRHYYENDLPTCRTRLTQPYR